MNAKNKRHSNLNDLEFSRNFLNQSFNSFDSNFKQSASCNFNSTSLDQNFKPPNPIMDENYYSDNSQRSEVASDEHSR